MNNQISQSVLQWTLQFRSQELKRFQKILLLMGISNPVAWAVLQFFVPTLFSPLWLFLLIAAVILGLHLASLSVRLVQRHIEAAVTFGAILTCLGTFILVRFNQLHPVLIVASFLGIVASATTFATRRFQLSFSLAILLMAAVLTPADGPLDKPVYFVGLCAAIIIAYIGFSDRSVIINSLRTSQERLLEIVEVSPEIFWTVSADLSEVHYLSPAFYSIHGIPAAESLENAPSLLETVHPEDRARVLEAFRKAQAQSFNIEYRVIRRDGKIRWIWNRGFPIVQENGRVRRISGVAADITEKVHTQEKLAESERMYNQILDAISDLVLLKGPYSKILWANRAFREYYGMTNEQLKNLIDAPFNRPDFTQQYVIDDSMVFQTGRTLDIPSEPVTRFDGQVRFFHTVKSPIFGKDGEVIMTVGVSRDITDKQRAEQTIAEHQAQLLSSSKMSTLGEMVGGIAHEINTPLATVATLSGQLQELTDDNPLDRKQIKKHAANIEKTIGRIGSIVRALRSFSREGTFDPLQSYPLKRIFEETLILCSERFRLHGIRLEVHSPPEDLTTECRPVEISHVLLNLLSNAHDAVENCPDKWVRIDFTETPADVTIRVADSGPGISAEAHRKLFQPFVTTKHSKKGTGIGLSISKKLVEANGGQITFDSESLRTCFLVRLPKKRATTEGTHQA